MCSTRWTSRFTKNISAAFNGALSESDICYGAKRGTISVVFEERRVATTLRRLRDHHANGMKVESQPYAPQSPRGPLSAEMKAKQQTGRKRKSQVSSLKSQVSSLKSPLSPRRRKLWPMWFGPPLVRQRCFSPLVENIERYYDHDIDERVSEAAGAFREEPEG